MCVCLPACNGTGNVLNRASVPMITWNISSLVLAFSYYTYTHTHLIEFIWFAYSFSIFEMLHNYLRSTNWKSVWQTGKDSLGFGLHWENLKMKAMQTGAANCYTANYHLHYTPFHIHESMYCQSLLLQTVTICSITIYIEMRGWNSY